MYFKNRQAAGEKLAEALIKYQGADLLVYALPRGGVVCAKEVAKKLKAPLDLVITRKIGHPANPEYAIGVVAEDGCKILTKEADYLDPAWLTEEITQQKNEAKRRRLLYLEQRPAIAVADKTAILIDDGLATGLTMKLAIEEVKHQRPQRLVVAVPVGPKDTTEELKQKVDEIIVLVTPPEPFGSIGQYYESFPQITDQEVINLMRLSS